MVTEITVTPDTGQLIVKFKLPTGSDTYNGGTVVVWTKGGTSAVRTTISSKDFVYDSCSKLYTATVPNLTSNAPYWVLVTGFFLDTNKNQYKVTGDAASGTPK